MRRRSSFTSHLPLGLTRLIRAGAAGFFLVLAPPVPVLHAASDAALPASLAPDSPVERWIHPGEVHAYTIRLAADEALHAVVMQDGADVILNLKSSAGTLLLSVDSPNGVRGPEDLFAVVGASGEHRLEVQGGTGAGRYRLTLDPPHGATKRDRLRASAAAALSRGDQCRRAGSAADYAAAQTLYRRAIALGERAGNAALARVARYRLASIYTATRRYPEAIALLRDLSPAWSDGFEGDALLNAIGNARKWMGDPGGALDFYRRSEAQADRLGDHRGFRVAVENQAEIYRRRAEYRKALDLERRALQKVEALGLDDERATVLGNIAQIRLNLGLWQEAADDSTEALATLRRNENCDTAQILQVLATAYVGLRQWQDAVDRFQEVRALAHARCGRSLEIAAANGLGFVYLKLGRLPAAVLVLEQARRSAYAAQDREGQGNALGNLGAVYSALRDTPKALDCFAQARKLYAGSPDAEAEILYGTAEALERAGRLAEARRAIAPAVEQVEQLRTRSAGSDLRSLFFASRQDSYELYIRILMELNERLPGQGYDAKAFDVAERTRARSLLDELAAAVETRSGSEPALRAREAELEHSLASVQRNRLAAATAHRSSAVLASLDDTIGSLISQLAEVRGIARLRRESRAALPDPRPLGLGEIQRRVLDAGTLLLAYSLGDRASFLWAVDRTSIHVYRLPGRIEVEALAKTTYEKLTHSATLEGGGEAAYCAAQLSRMLLGPVASDLAERRLLIVADGALQYIPFAALPEPRSLADSTVAGDPPPLFVAHEIVHLASVSLIPLLRERAANRRPAPKLVAVLADPVFQPNDRHLTERDASAPAERGVEDDAVRSARDVGETGLDPLPYTRREAEAILALTPAGTSLKATGYAASRELATGPELALYRFLHFATHGFLDARHPELSGLVLSQVDASGRRRNGFLHAYEIYDLQLSADLVVLSACQTALGAEIRGEGLVGLTRGFMYAGVPRVMVSLWNINDHATADLMAEFYHGVLQRGLTPAAALRAAQLATWKQHRWHAPYFWAAFELQGDWR